jgi:hypothetical protein
MQHLAEAKGGLETYNITYLVWLTQPLRPGDDTKLLFFLHCQAPTQGSVLPCPQTGLKTTL